MKSRTRKATLAAGPCFVALATAAVLSMSFAQAQSARNEKSDAPPAPRAEVKLRIAAASDLRFALDQLMASPAGRAFKLKTEIVYGSSGQFTQQIEAGAPFDVFLSADESYAGTLKAHGKVEGEPFNYGRGRLVLWSLKNFKMDWQPQQGLALLKQAAVIKIAIANPEHAPYGALADRALRASGVRDQIKDRLIMADSVAQAAQFAQTGAVSVGLIAEALATAPAMQSQGRYFRIDEKIAPPLLATGVILKNTTHAFDAQKFRDLLLGREGQAELATFGLARDH